MRRMARSALSLSLFVSLIIAACGVAPASTVMADTGAVPRLEPAPCMWQLPTGQIEGQTVRCGFVVVLEQHRKPDGPTIRLPVAVFKSTAANPVPDPIIYLQGGPGGAVGDFITGFLDGKIDTYTANRDLIVFDQRGVGLAQPTLDCPEVQTQDLADVATLTSPDDRTTHEIASIATCRDRLTKQGITLGAYTSAEGAADVNDIRAALGYQKLNLFGISYGTRLGLTIMRDFPAIVRSAVLDSSVPLQANLIEDDGINFDRSFKALFTSCTADVTCNAKYPTFQADYATDVAQLNAQPISTSAKDTKSGATVPVVVDGYELTFLVSQMLYDSTATRYIAPLVEQVKAGQTSILNLVLNAYGPTGPDINIGAYFSVMCGEEVPFNNRDRAAANARGLVPELRQTFLNDVREHFEVCAQWPTLPINPAETQPVRSDVPALVLSSDNDPATPPDYGKQTAQTLSHGYLITFPGIGHSVLANGGDCGLSLILAFIADPSKQPATDCVGQSGG